MTAVVKFDTVETGKPLQKTKFGAIARALSAADVSSVTYKSY